MANEKKGKISLTIRSRNNKPKNTSSNVSNDTSNLKELNKAFETSKNEKPAKKAKKEKKDKKDKKDKPKRPLNAYMVFAMEVRESVKKNNPTAGITDIAKKIGALWRALSDSEKAKYKK
jgi:hypothetical protein